MTVILLPYFPRSRYLRALLSSQKASLGNGAPKEGPFSVPNCPICNPQKADLGIGIQEPLLSLCFTQKTNAERNTHKKFLDFWILLWEKCTGEQNGLPHGLQWGQLG